MKNCKVCNKLFKPYGKQKSCSKECQKEIPKMAWKEWAAINRPKLPSLSCYVCNKEFVPLFGYQFMCGSMACKLVRDKSERRRKNKERIESLPDELCHLCGDIYKPNCTQQRRCRRKKCIVEYQRKWAIEKRRTDMNHLIKGRLRSRLRAAIKADKASKSASTLELLSCTIDDFRLYIESLFLPEMSWENHGEWHLDHITPCASFDLTKKGQQMDCFHFSNFQPLWASDNLTKGAKIDI